VSSCPEPGEPGYIPGVFQAFALTIGLRFAAEVGLGLPLVNALSERFPDLDQAMIGEIASLVGEGVRAGTLLTADEMGSPIDVANLPVVSPDFHPGDRGDRIIAGVDVTWTDSATGNQETRRVWINSLEILTPEDLLSEAEALFEAAMAETNPLAEALVTNVIMHLVFIATRY
jgi:hypothetical protein